MKHNYILNIFYTFTQLFLIQLIIFYFTHLYFFKNIFFHLDTIVIFQLALNELLPIGILLIFFSGIIKDYLYYLPLGFTAIYYLTICLFVKLWDLKNNIYTNLFVFIFLICIGINLDFCLNSFILGVFKLPIVKSWLTTGAIYLLWVTTCSLKRNYYFSPVKGISS